MKKINTPYEYELPPLDWAEVGNKAIVFAEKYAGKQGETELINKVQNDQRFWADFFKLFNLDARNFGRFQHAAPRASNKSKRGEADFLWRGKAKPLTLFCFLKFPSFARTSSVCQQHQHQRDVLSYQHLPEPLNQ